MLATNQRALCYLPSPHDPRELSLLRSVLSRAKLRLREVTEEELALPIGLLAGYSDSEAQEGASPHDPIREPVLVLCGLPGNKVNDLLDRMRGAGLAPIACKAVLTETNRHWNFYRLYEELCRERQAMANGAPPLHNP